MTLGAKAGRAEAEFRGRGRRRHVFRQPGDLERAGAMGQAADEAALLQAGDQAVNAGFRFQTKGFLHFVEGGTDAAVTQPLVDEQQQFVLFLGQHRRLSSAFAGPIHQPQ